jgi:hypothetical protein
VGAPAVVVPRHRVADVDVESRGGELGTRYAHGDVEVGAPQGRDHESSETQEEPGELWNTAVRHENVSSMK